MCHGALRVTDGCVSQSVAGAAAEQKNGRKDLETGTGERKINSSAKHKPSRGINVCQVSLNQDFDVVPFNFFFFTKGAVANARARG